MGRLEFRVEHTDMCLRNVAPSSRFLVSQFLLYGLVEADDLDNFPESSLEVIFKILGLYPYSLYHVPLLFQHSFPVLLFRTSASINLL